MLIQKIQEDLTTSLKAKQSDVVETLRFLMSDIKNAEIEKGIGSELTDDEVLKIISKNVKKLKEAAEMFEKGGRQELADENNAQIAIFEKYLPTQLTDEELDSKISEIRAQNAELAESNPNALIGIAMKQLSGQAEPGRIMAALKK